MDQIDQIDKIDQLTDTLDEMNIEDTHFVIDNYISYTKNEMKMITKIDMNFYQIWSLLGELPILRRQGKSKYEWRFIRKDIPNVIFTIYDYNNKNNFLNTKVWYLASTTHCKQHNKEFIDTFLDGIKCYNTYYHQGIETRNFTSENTIIHKNLQKIKSELIEYRDLIKAI
jgi:hypothetical protein